MAGPGDRPRAPKQPGPAAAAPAVTEVPEPPPWWRTLRADPAFHIRVVIGAGLIAVVLAIWWFFTRGDATTAIISPSKLPSPGAVFGSLPTLKDSLFDGVAATLVRVLLGVVIAAVVGVVLGVFAGTNRAIGS
ncbi:MAG TPA: hypothetical protein VFT22_44155, partial [Kofleriaceae bacterium]|nr:hypothetical protein [Kofleriaceae bacterium]